MIMRKLFLLFTTLIALFLYGCSKDEGVDNQLVGTYWQTPDVATSLLFSGKWYHVIHFISPTEYQYYREHNDSIEKFFHQSQYSLDYPNLNINMMGEYTLINSTTFRNKLGDGYYSTWTKR